jgi:hypothetical protein
MRDPWDKRVRRLVQHEGSGGQSTRRPVIQKKRGGERGMPKEKRREETPGPKGRDGLWKLGVDQMSGGPAGDGAWDGTTGGIEETIGRKWGCCSDGKRRRTGTRQRNKLTAE